jgi:hypothetical protein
VLIPNGPALSPATSLPTDNVNLTFAIPLSTIPSSLAAEPETSTARPGMYGPRSLMQAASAYAAHSCTSSPAASLFGTPEREVRIL